MSHALSAEGPWVWRSRQNFERRRRGVVGFWWFSFQGSIAALGRSHSEVVCVHGIASCFSSLPFISLSLSLPPPHNGCTSANWMKKNTKTKNTLQSWWDHMYGTVSEVCNEMLKSFKGISEEKVEELSHVWAGELETELWDMNLQIPEGLSPRRGPRPVLCWMRENRLKLQEDRFQLNIRSNLLIGREVWHWKRIPRGVSLTGDVQAERLDRCALVFNCWARNH